MAEQAQGAAQPKNKELKDTGYELFILLLSLVSIFNMAIAFISGFVTFDQDLLDVLLIIDSILTIFFLFDFCYRILHDVFQVNLLLQERAGWADLLACIPMLAHLPPVPHRARRASDADLRPEEHDQ